MTTATGATVIEGGATTGLDREGKRLFWGVSGLYLALYLHYGFFAFIPLWLKTMGASPEEIGILLAIPLVLRILTVAPFSAWAKVGLAAANAEKTRTEIMLEASTDAFCTTGKVEVVLIYFSVKIIVSYSRRLGNRAYEGLCVRVVRV